MDSLVEMFCNVDDFCQAFEPHWEQQQLTAGMKRRRRSGQLCLSEVMTIVIHFHQSSYRNFKAYYLKHGMVHLRSEFPNLVSYPCFVTLMKETLLPLAGYLYSLFGACSGVSFVDSTPLVLCHNRRIQQHKVFEGIAARGKTSMGWFYGFKLHLVVNDQLKNISQFEHSRHRLTINFVVNVLAGLITYCHQPKKPALQFVDELYAIVSYP